jgi:hypothetical protein
MGNKSRGMDVCNYSDQDQDQKRLGLSLGLPLLLPAPACSLLCEPNLRHG